MWRNFRVCAFIATLVPALGSACTYDTASLRVGSQGLDGGVNEHSDGSQEADSPLLDALSAGVVDASTPKDALPPTSDVDAMQKATDAPVDASVAIDASPRNRQWTLRSIGVRTPPGRRQHAMAFDSRRNTLVLFGGFIEGQGFVADTWEWNPSTGVWTDRTPASLPSLWPLARSGHKMVYIDELRKVVLVGGSTGNNSGVADMWTWDGLAGVWERLRPTTLPYPRSWFGLTYDTRRKRAVLFGGGNEKSGQLNDTWEWEPQSGEWVERFPTLKPPGRQSFDLVYDSDRGLAEFFAADGAIWEWHAEAETWLRSQTEGTRPSIMVDSVSAYDPNERGMLTFDGIDLFRWRTTAKQWEDLGPFNAQETWPGPRIEPAATFVPSRGSFVLFSGCTRGSDRRPYEDLWEW